MYLISDRDKQKKKKTAPGWGRGERKEDKRIEKVCDFNMIRHRGSLTKTKFCFQHK